VTDDDYVTCSVCGKRYKGRIPRGGDGTVLYPRRHRIKIFYTTNLGLSPRRPRYERCEGSFRAAVEYQKGP